jgi:glycosyltransferase involved in cell wall biosynthesis
MIMSCLHTTPEGSHCGELHNDKVAGDVSAAMDRRMQVSIVICTHNRAEDLRLTLESLAQAEVPDQCDAEVVIVDNGSTDHTRQVVQNAQITEMRVTYLYDEWPNKSNALNRGIREASGSILMLTDDDVRFPTQWIEKMCRPIAANLTDATGGGIRIAPHLRRRWLLEAFPCFCAALETTENLQTPVLFGANMAFARKILERVPGFDVALGPGALGNCEDSLFVMQMRDAGYRLQMVHDAWVEHYFDAARLQPKSIMKAARNLGRSEAYVHLKWKKGSLLSWRWGRVLRKTAAYTVKRLLRPKEWACEESAPYWAVDAMTAYWFLRQYCTERLKKRVPADRALAHASDLARKIASSPSTIPAPTNPSRSL